MRYARVYADSSGESHFEDVEVEVSSVAFAPPAAPVNLSAFVPAKQYAFITVPPVVWSPALPAGTVRVCVCRG